MKTVAAFVVTVALCLGVALAVDLPEELTLVCGETVVGSASYRDGELEVEFWGDVSLCAEVSVLEDASLYVEVTISGDALAVTITGIDGSVEASKVDVDIEDEGAAKHDRRPEGTELPQVAQDGMAKAAQNRAEAAERAASAGVEVADLPQEAQDGMAEAERNRAAAEERRSVPEGDEEDDFEGDGEDEEAAEAE